MRTCCGSKDVLDFLPKSNGIRKRFSIGEVNRETVDFIEKPCWIISSAIPQTFGWKCTSGWTAWSTNFSMEPRKSCLSSTEVAVLPLESLGWPLCSYLLCPEAGPVSGPVGCSCEEQSSTQGRLVCVSLCLIIDVKGEGILGKLMILRHICRLSA